MMLLLLEIEHARPSFSSAVSGAWEPIRSARRRALARYGIPPGFSLPFLSWANGPNTNRNRGPGNARSGDTHERLIIVPLIVQQHGGGNVDFSLRGL